MTRNALKCCKYMIILGAYPSCDFYNLTIKIISVQVALCHHEVGEIGNRNKEDADGMRWCGAIKTNSHFLNVRFYLIGVSSKLSTLKANLPSPPSQQGPVLSPISMARLRVCAFVFDL